MALFVNGWEVHPVGYGPLYSATVGSVTIRVYHAGSAWPITLYFVDSGRLLRRQNPSDDILLSIPELMPPGMFIDWLIDVDPEAERLTNS